MNSYTKSTERNNEGDSYNMLQKSILQSETTYTKPSPHSVCRNCEDKSFIIKNLSREKEQTKANLMKVTSDALKFQKLNSITKHDSGCQTSNAVVVVAQLELDQTQLQLSQKDEEIKQLKQDNALLQSRDKAFLGTNTFNIFRYD